MEGPPPPAPATAQSYALALVAGKKLLATTKAQEESERVADKLALTRFQAEEKSRSAADNNKSAGGGGAKPLKATTISSTTDTTTSATAPILRAALFGGDKVIVVEDDTAESTIPAVAPLWTPAEILSEALISGGGFGASAIAVTFIRAPLPRGTGINFNAPPALTTIPLVSLTTVDGALAASGAEGCVTITGLTDSEVLNQTPSLVTAALAFATSRVVTTGFGAGFRFQLAASMGTPGASPKCMTLSLTNTPTVGDGSGVSVFTQLLLNEVNRLTSSAEFRMHVPSVHSSRLKPCLDNALRIVKDFALYLFKVARMSSSEQQAALIIADFLLNFFFGGQVSLVTPASTAATMRAVGLLMSPTTGAQLPMSPVAGGGSRGDRTAVTPASEGYSPTGIPPSKKKARVGGGGGEGRGGKESAIPWAARADNQHLVLGDSHCFNHGPGNHASTTCNVKLAGTHIFATWWRTSKKAPPQVAQSFISANAKGKGA